MAQFNINDNTGLVTFKTSPNYEAPTDSDENNVYNITVTDVFETQAISLGKDSAGKDNGQLIKGVKVEGNWYYYWDRNGDSITGGEDYTSHDILDDIFNKDIDGLKNTTVANKDGEYGTTDTYRYATINGVKLALPTANGGADYPRPIDDFQNGTAYSDTTEGGASDATTSTPFNELLAIWDAFNGTSTEQGLNGTPSGWTANNYWSATTSASGHASVNLEHSSIDNEIDTVNAIYVALQVL